MAGEDKRLLQVEGLKKHFPVERGFLRKVIGHVRAVDDVTFSIGEGETLGVVGESGCGKTTLGLTILRGEDPTEGKILFNLEKQGMTDIAQLRKQEMKDFRRQAQMIFQDPYSSLDPRMTVIDIVSEPLVVNRLAKRKEIQQRVEYLMDVVGLDVRYLKRYPHAFSGGQRQRIGIARALSTNPRFLVCDEPTSALDVSIQAQILNLMQDLQEEFGLTYMFIAHDLSVVQHVSNRVAIMYLGKIAESGPKEAIFGQPQHPYTEALLRSVPIADPKIQSGLESAPGEIGNPMNPPSGCYFHPRCAYAEERCREEGPELRELDSQHFAACHLAEKLDLEGVIV